MRAVQARRIPRVAVVVVAAAVVTALATPVASPTSSTALAAEAPGAAPVDGTGAPLQQQPLTGSADNGVRDGAVAGPAARPRTAPVRPRPGVLGSAPALLTVDSRSTVDAGSPGSTVAVVTGAGAVVSATGFGTGAADIPSRVLIAYQRAATRLATDDPSCRITWQDIAGIGKVESDHAGGGRVDANGVTITPILGPVLDGVGVAAIRDTDGGVLDGNTTWDRAVGPMQFIPGSWKVWGADADGDGTANPHDIDDAALGTGRYLCAGSRDLSTSAGLAQAVFSYNHSAAYVQLVVSWIRRYTAGGAVGVGQPVDLPIVAVGPSTPDPRPIPGPGSTAGPAPVPRTAPTTALTPAPAPTTGPTAAPTPAPVPTAEPTPVPTGGPAPAPAPPTAGPLPTAKPVPTPPRTTPPGPRPTPVPVPPRTPGPQPTPRPPAITAPPTSPAPSTTPTPSPTPTATSTATATPTATAAPTPCASPSPTPTADPRPAVTAPPTAGPAPTPCPTGSADGSPTLEPSGSGVLPVVQPSRGRS